MREELARIGDGAAPVAVSSDVWARGRRARRRDRLAAGGAALSVLVVLAGAGLTLRGSGSDVPPVATGVEAVPSVIHPVPERLGFGGIDADATWKPSIGESDLAIGRASVAFASGGYQPLPAVITAADGAYHLLQLPGWIGTSLAANMTPGMPLALSPDGRSLAWGWYDASTRGSAQVTAGVRIVDLETGRIRTIRLEGARGVEVASLQWSPDSRWLVWQGAELKRWEVNNTSWGRNVAGRIAPGATVSTSIAVSRGGGEQLAIDDEGTVAWVADGSYRFNRLDLAGTSTGHIDVLGNRPVAAGRFGPGASFAFATNESSSVATFFYEEPRRTPDDDGTLAYKDNAAMVPVAPTTRDLPDDRFPADIEPMGWIDPDHVVELVTPVHPISEAGWTEGDSELVVMSLGDGEQPAYDAVAHVAQGEEHDGRIRGVTVAVDLMTLDHPTRDFPAPEWPWSDERKLAVFGGAGVAVVAALVFVVSYRRGRRQTP
ncbi:hypothetical protein [Nocardioides jejuensis]|uniref:WD40 repeat domain-containing protein n=1 Tax=Nocardioides jejuensis TaxID=2502782 RepID=A0A4R1CHG7_9ACTN|nr:hypothetical protein [Nocardioides jejuensis]TCJ29885.1 hypothetical protein EPD65_06185 [Nocardioides jejuensis]